MVKEKILLVGDSLQGPTGSDAVYRSNSIYNHRAKSVNSSNNMENTEVNSFGKTNYHRNAYLLNLNYENIMKARVLLIQMRMKIYAELTRWKSVRI